MSKIVNGGSPEVVCADACCGARAMHATADVAAPTMHQARRRRTVVNCLSLRFTELHALRARPLSLHCCRPSPERVCKFVLLHPHHMSQAPAHAL